MQTLTYQILINASPNLVWEGLWKEENYRNWTSVFSEGSHYKTETLQKGSKIHFLNPDGHGMYSVINELIPNEFMEFKHLGIIKDFVEQPLSDEPMQWANSIENYSLKSENEHTLLTVHVDMVDEYVDYMNEKFPLALQKLKERIESR